MSVQLSRQQIDKDYALDRAPALVLSVIDDTLTTPPGGQTAGNAYVPKSPAQGAWTGLSGHLVEWSGSAWVDIKTLAVDDHLLVSPTPEGSSSFGGHAKEEARVTATSPLTYSFSAPVEGDRVLIDGDGGYYENTEWTYDQGAWVQLGGGTAAGDGNSVYYLAQGSFPVLGTEGTRTTGSFW